MKLSELTDTQVIRLYQEWSEDTFCAGFIGPDESTVAHFIRDLPEYVKIHLQPRALLDYERQMLDEFRRQVAD